VRGAVGAAFAEGLPLIHSGLDESIDRGDTTLLYSSLIRGQTAIWLRTHWQ